MDIYSIISHFTSVAHAAEEAAHEAANTGIAGMFGLNANLFLAQLINFGIIMLVLWKWVFGPVTKGLQNRTAKIEKSLQDAETVEQEKQNFEVWRTAEMTTARKEAAEIVAKAKTDAESVRTHLLSQTKAEQEKVIAQTKEQLKSEQARSVAEVKQEIATLVVAASQKILRGKLDPKTDKELIKESLKEAA
jgi:F-type H+-transporting ATPase subunit b